MLLIVGVRHQKGRIINDDEEELLSEYLQARRGVLGISLLRF